MGLFSKKEKVPEIPPAPQLPELPSAQIPSAIEKKGLPELPSFPSDSRHENINQEIVKHAVSDIPQEYQTPEDNEVVVDMPPQSGFHNRGNLIPSLSNIPQIPKTSLPTINKTEENRRRTLELAPQTNHQLNQTKQLEPIFIRIDKFQSAQNDFKQIKLKVKEIESVLRKIKEIKTKEQSEINSWTEDLEKLKARIAEIDSNIFNKL